MNFLILVSSSCRGGKMRDLTADNARFERAF